ncbi:MAG: hypothetical protein ABIW76_09885 [Fibrobacteria bacterium]
MIFKWLPWKYLVRRVARHHGFLDPILILSRLGKFAQPSEVGEPIELLRAGLVFHARGLMNTRAIQNNLDWIWPYWVERQFNPRDPSFIPRAFSISHINLSHRNWTCVGMPDAPYLPIVDPSGLVTPYYDGWSLDAWILPPDGPRLFPSKSKQAVQSLALDAAGVAVDTRLEEDGMRLESRVEARDEGAAGQCHMRVLADSKNGGWLAISLRPYNPEGVSFIHDVRLDSARKSWIIDGYPAVAFSEPASRHYASEYHVGDVFHKLVGELEQEDQGSHCKVGLATAAVLFPLRPGERKSIEVKIDLAGDKETPKQFPVRRPPSPWAPALAGLARLETPEPNFDFLYQAAIRTLILHSPDEVFPGPYTYKRFWFRDAAIILNAMLATGMGDRVVRTLDLFPSKQTHAGYYLSQEGEWDSNGEALWILWRWCEMTGSSPKPAWLASIAKGAEWIMRKRVVRHAEPSVIGLLPAGFSAEHLGPNDYYYWDDFWGVAGLQAAARLLEGSGREAAVAAAKQGAMDFLSAIDRSLKSAVRKDDLKGALPASPLRRMDSGAVGSIAVSYPLNIWPGDDARVKATLEFLLDKCMVKGSFFQDMIHSGMNAYLTLHMAQCLLRLDDPRFFQLVKDTAAVASPTGQWPEAIHPHTLGGCMGDGQHVWAAAEWALMMRNMFMREEENVLVIGSGIPETWLQSGKSMSFGPGPTRFGAITVTIHPALGGVKVSWKGEWRKRPACIVVKLPGRKSVTVTEAGDWEVLI